VTIAKLWAMGGFLLGILVSIAGNVLHAWHPDAETLAAAGVTAEQWRPELSAQLFSAFYPVALLVTVEVLARVPWPRSWGWAAARYGGASLVAAVSGVVSYMHLSGLLKAYGESRLIVLIGPLAVDGLMIVCGFALLTIGQQHSRTAALQTTGEQPPDYSLSREPQTPPIGPAPLAIPADATTGSEAALSAPKTSEAPADAEGETPTVSAEGDTETGQDFSGLDEPSAPAQRVVTDLPSAVISARTAGLSIQKIADEFGITKYRVEKILKSADPDADPATATAPGLEIAGV